MLIISVPAGLGVQARATFVASWMFNLERGTRVFAESGAALPDRQPIDLLVPIPGGPTMTVNWTVTAGIIYEAGLKLGFAPMRRQVGERLAQMDAESPDVKFLAAGYDFSALPPLLEPATVRILKAQRANIRTTKSVWLANSISSWKRDSTEGSNFAVFLDFAGTLRKFHGKNLALEFLRSLKTETRLVKLLIIEQGGRRTAVFSTEGSAMPLPPSHASNPPGPPPAHERVCDVCRKRLRIMYAVTRFTGLTSYVLVECLQCMGLTSAKTALRWTVERWLLDAPGSFREAFKGEAIELRDDAVAESNGAGTYRVIVSRDGKTVITDGPALALLIFSDFPEILRGATRIVGVEEIARFRLT